ncbi:hypothetical protein M407DRAFT_17847 [Tulasnella calospora MUT 4182]|uniref:Uncharacterized protein n=1 Tax=Tulasnella calospora MUT 4182 TaxID=1051891 RepID=A0A0C3QKZ5_9AGAM|nr:hypothetical protein M407DRAFT_17847 [Tulasnella calospora MUT 4182]
MKNQLLAVQSATTERRITSAGLKESRAPRLSVCEGRPPPTSRRASPALLMAELLGTQKGIEAVAEFIKATGAFTKSGRETWRRALEEDATVMPAPAITVRLLP